jgi:D-lyxose ketol-isomerase
MKRSQINKEIAQAKHLFEQVGFKLPPFAFWTIADWRKKHAHVQEIIDNRLGWDVTDYGGKNFDDNGLLLFTIRNGNPAKKQTYPKTYAEKIMVIKEGQVAPMHFHWKKTEDIINRGGGDLVIVLHQSGTDEALSDIPVTVSIDGFEKKVAAGQEIVLTPGESIFLPPYLYHKFYAKTGSGTVVIGEVSQVNDDENDNRFLEPIGRFPAIEEDEPPLHLLCTEYEKWILSDC